MAIEFRRDEEGRLKSLEQLAILDTAPEAPFEKIVSLVKQTLNLPICAVSLIDRNRQWFKASRGYSFCETPRDISFCTHAINDTVPFLIADATKNPLFAASPLVAGEPHIRSYAGIPPTMADGYNMGALCACDIKPREFTPPEVAILTSFAKLVVDELELRRIVSQDALTGVMSRRAWFEAAREAFARAGRSGRDLALLALDIDHFKSINDRYGHAGGDAVLKGFAQVVSDNVRQGDFLGRLGGEEFAVLLPDTGPADALKLAERICEAVRTHTFAEVEDCRITVSIGYAPRLVNETGPETALQRADLALYAAKNAGRDRVVEADAQTTQQKSHQAV